MVYSYSNHSFFLYIWILSFFLDHIALCKMTAEMSLLMLFFYWKQLWWWTYFALEGMNYNVIVPLRDSSVTNVVDLSRESLTDNQWRTWLQ